MTMLLALALVNVAILMHELGHYAAARWRGIPVKIVSVGFGPRLLGWTIGTTDYRWSLIPLGGYVLFGVYHPAATSAPTARRQSWRQRIAGALRPSVSTIHLTSRCGTDRVLVALAGPTANLALMVVLLALHNGLTAGLSPEQVLVRPMAQSGMLLHAYLDAWTHGITPADVVGIIGVIKIGAIWITSPERGLQFAVILNLGLAVTNLLPIPPLDGGHVLLAVTTKLFPRSSPMLAPLQIIGTALVLTLMVVTTINDIAR